MSWMMVLARRPIQFASEVEKKTPLGGAVHETPVAVEFTVFQPAD